MEPFKQPSGGQISYRLREAARAEKLQRGQSFARMLRKILPKDWKFFLLAHPRANSSMAHYVTDLQLHEVIRSMSAFMHSNHHQVDRNAARN